MRKVINVLLGVWCAVTALATPIWLTLAYLNISGMIYKYDDSMDAGTALIFGILFLALWILFALLSDILFIRRMYKIRRKYAYVAFAAVVLLCVLCIAVCKWNIIGFLATIGFI